jgi:rhodanese-related sulfurtransferase
MSVQSVSCQQALAMQAQGALILDVREPWELEIAVIDGALNIPMQAIPEAIDALPREQDLLLLCHHGMRLAALTLGPGKSILHLRDINFFAISHDN